MSDREGGPQPAATSDGFSLGIDDLIIIPVVAIVFAIRKTLRALFRALIDLVDWAFPILLQVMRFPLFTLRIIGDAIVVLLKGIVRFLPIGPTRRDSWREVVSQYWAWLRGKISYKAFEEWLHHAFENGMAWVFRTCRTLSPRAALLVLAGAVLWLPISFGVATLMHAVLFAKALVWPAWVQLLHPVATVIAKSKLLVLPVYPAAWPQAKLHPMVQAMIRSWNYLATLYLTRKIAYRYRQTERATITAYDAFKRSGTFAVLGRIGNDLLGALNAVAAWLGQATRAILTRLGDGLSKAPVIGAIISRYDVHYDDANRTPSTRFSARARAFFARWSTKFTAEYYEAKEREQAASGLATSSKV